MPVPKSSVGVRLNSVYTCSYEDLLPSIKAGTIAAVLTDPPFGIAYQSGWVERTRPMLKNDEQGFSYRPLADWAWRVLKPESPLFAFTHWSTYSDHFTDVMNSGLEVKEPLVIQKHPSGLGNLQGSFRSSYDIVIFATKGSFKFRQTTLMKNSRAGSTPNSGRLPTPEYKTRFDSAWIGKQFPYSTVPHSKSSSSEHPTQKSVSCMKWLIQLTTDPGDTVLDPFCGSGTTAIACLETGRNFITCEIDPDFADLARERIEIHHARTHEK